jgi:peptidoglycan/LPS O-acetylase OafA/YrhL
VLSGFLVGGLLLKEWKHGQRIDVRRFLIRRGFKIWPAYFVYLGFIIFCFLWRSPPEARRSIWVAMAPNFFHLQNYIPTLAFHTWTLAVEEHFYLLLPASLFLLASGELGKRGALLAAIAGGALLAALFAGIGVLVVLLLSSGLIQSELIQYYQPYTHGSFLLFFWGQLFAFLLLFLATWYFRPGIHALPVIAGGSLLLCAAFRALTHWLSPQFQADISLPIYGSHMRMDSLFFGVLLAYFWHFKPERLEKLAKRRGALLLGGFALLSLVVFWPLTGIDVCLIDRSFLYLACGAMLLALLYMEPDGKLLTNPIAKLIAGIGYYSYSIYLWHINPPRYVLISMTEERLKPFLGVTERWALLTMLYMVVSVLTGILLGKLIESPMLHLRDRLFPSRA